MNLKGNYSRLFFSLCPFGRKIAGLFWQRAAADNYRCGDGQPFGPSRACDHKCQAKACVNECHDPLGPNGCPSPHLGYPLCPLRKLPGKLEFAAIDIFAVFMAIF